MNKIEAVLQTFAPVIIPMLSAPEDVAGRDRTFLFCKGLFDTYQRDGDANVGLTLMLRFLDKVYPETGQRHPDVVRWVCRAYVEHRHNGKPILAEDLYKLRDDVAYFDRLKKSQPFRLNGDNPDLLQYKSYAALMDTLQRYKDARAAREDARHAFHVTPEQREIIEEESTFLYDGPEGKAVVVHTPRASQYWGRNTKWCISGTGTYEDGEVYADRHFPYYNGLTPVIMLLPKKGGSAAKMAIVDGTLWNAEDISMDAMPETHAALWQAVLAAQNMLVAARLRKLATARAKRVKKDYLAPLTPEQREIAIRLRDNWPFTHQYAKGRLESDLRYEGNTDLNMAMALVDVYSPSMNYYVSACPDREMVKKLIEERPGCVTYGTLGPFDYDYAKTVLRVRPDAFVVFPRLLMEHRETMWFAMVNDPQGYPSLGKYSVQAVADLYHALLPDLPAGRLAYFESLVAKGGEREYLLHRVRHDRAVWGDVEAQFSSPSRALAKIRAALPKADRKVYRAMKKAAP